MDLIKTTDFVLKDSDIDYSSLFVTFYISKSDPSWEQIKEQFEKCISDWGKKQNIELTNYPNQQITHLSVDSDGIKDIYYHLFMPSGSIDTLALQIWSNCKTKPEHSWPKMRNTLTSLLEPWYNWLFYSDYRKIVFGSSVVYKADSESSKLLNEHRLSEEVLKVVNTLFQETQLIELCQTKVVGGYLYLLDIPLSLEHHQIVYIAIGSIEENINKVTHNSISTQVIQGPNADLQIIDVSAHKTYFQWNQIDKLRTAYISLYEDLQRHTSQLLKSIGNSEPNQDSLKAIASKFRNLIEDKGKFTQLYIGLRQQEKKFLLLSNKSDYRDNKIYQFHYDHTKVKCEDVELLLNSSQVAIDQAKTAIEISEAEQNKRSNDISELNQILLSIFGVLLTVYQIIDDGATKHILQRFSVTQTFTHIILTRIVGSVLVAFIVWLILSWIKKCKSKQKSKIS